MINTIYEFADNVKEILAKRLPDCQVKVHNVVKNNDTALTGIAIRQKGSSVSPVIYLNQFYEQYQDGLKNEEETADAIENLYHSKEKQDLSKINADSIQNFEHIKKNIGFRLVNAQRNEKRLKDMPYRTVLDLAVTYGIHVGELKDTVCSVSVTEKMRKTWCVTEEMLYKLALQNTPKQNRGIVKPLAPVLKGLCGCGDGDGADAKTFSYRDFDITVSEGSKSLPLYIATNKSGIHGASTILFPDFMDKVGSLLGNFFILPSSIHETLLLPADDETKPQGLLEIVYNVNRNIISEEEILSDNVYHYDVNTKKLSIVS